MNTKQIDKLMHYLLVLSGILILAGAFFRLQHYPNGLLLLYIGFISNFLLSSIEIDRLKRRNKLLENSDSPSKKESL